MISLRAALLVSVLALPSLLPAQQSSGYPFAFRDAGVETGLLPDVGGIRGHGVAWGDLDGSGFPSLFVAPFHDQGSKPGQLFRNDKGKFRLDGQEHLRTSGMGSGALFVDLTNNGRLDLYVSTCAIKSKAPERQVPSYLFRNDGNGKFTDISKEAGIPMPLYAGRGIAATDVDGDGLADLVTTERYYGAVQVGPVLFKNQGNYRFTNIAAEAGLPSKLSSLGVAVTDVNLDGWPDLFFTEGDGEHRLLLNDGKGKFTEAPGSRDVFRWKDAGKDDTPAGVAIADLNRDGLPDIVIGHHYGSHLQKPKAIRVYLNRGVKNGVPTFEDVTEQVGILPLPMKPPHIEIQDFDNDGWPDIYVSIVVFKDGKPCPVIYKNLGVKDGLPRFREDAMALTDWPTEEDKALKRSGPLFDKILKEKKIIYSAAAPTGDFDRDGKLDIFLANWWKEAPSILMRNETPGGNWLDVQVEGKSGVNRMGLGSRVRVYPAGKLGQAAALLGAREIAVGYGYCSGQEAVAHFGLGKEASVDVEVMLPHGKGTLSQKGDLANQRLVVR